MPTHTNLQSLDDFAETLLSRLRNDPGWFLYEAMNKALPDDQQLKPWDELSETQRSTIVRQVRDMSSWQAESRVDPDDLATRLEHCPELRALLA